MKNTNNEHYTIGDALVIIFTDPMFLLIFVVIIALIIYGLIGVFNR